jgi:hypothetical protein
MKAKKALKKLKRVETLLSNVIDQYAANERGVRELLDFAKASVVRAKARVKSQSAPRIAKKSHMKTKKNKHGHLTAEGRKRISLAAKKRWALAKRTSARKTGSPAKSAAESDSRKSGSPTPPMTRPAGRPLAPEASAEPSQQQHEPQTH